ncbi:hypothetical protein [Cerasicoccus maritimus]|uniref:hypothetical protein n=1 Tax=Cerasicoccus maritimus TaxID=490089 RepID=UPI002852C69C|nr:hypothetical protein [Cerasicoccus maritimus]
MKIPPLILTLSLSTCLCQGAFVLVDDMENGNNWGAGSQGSIVADPTNASNNVYLIDTSPVSSGNVTAAFHSITSIDNNTTGTLFFRIRSDAAAPNFVWGSSDVASPNVTGNFNSFGDYEGYGRIADADYGFQLRDGGGFTGDLENGAADTWYNVWLELDNTNDTTTLYVTTGSDDATSAIGSGAFRNGTTSGLVTLLVVNAHGGGNDYIDDIYIDTTGQNLTNPTTIPEPRSYALLIGLLGTCVLLLRRSRI